MDREGGEVRTGINRLISQTGYCCCRGDSRAGPSCKRRVPASSGTKRRGRAACRARPRRNKRLLFRRANAEAVRPFPRPSQGSRAARLRVEMAFLDVIWLERAAGQPQLRRQIQVMLSAVIAHVKKKQWTEREGESGLLCWVLQM